jgi:hypothetical protein
MEKMGQARILLPKQLKTKRGVGVIVKNFRNRTARLHYLNMPQ